MDNEDGFELVRLNGHSRWRHIASGRIVPRVRGAADDTDDDDDDEEGGDASQKDRTFTQAEVSEIAAREKREGRKAGKNEVLEQLGFKKVEEVKTALAKASTQGSENDEAINERVRDLEKREAAASAREGELARRNLEMEATFSLVEAGLSAKAAKRAARLLEIKDDTEVDDISDLVKDLQRDMPEMFSKNSSDGEGDGEEEAQNSGLPNSTPPRPKAERKQAAKATDEARSLLQSRHPRQFAQS